MDNVELVLNVDGVEEPTVHVIAYIPKWGYTEVYGWGLLLMVGDDGGDGIIIVVDGG